MKLAITFLACSMAMALAGCGLWGRRQAKVIPPPPKPTTASKPAQKPAQVASAPLSFPQTHAQLPAPQPVSPEAVTPAPPPEETEAPDTGTSSTPKPARHPAAPAAGTPPPPKPEPQPPPAPVEERPRLKPILPADEQRKIADAISARTREIKERISQAEKRRLTDDEQAMIARIQSFVMLADEAANRGDMAQADALSGRALVLARELQIAK